MYFNKASMLSRLTPYSILQLTCSVSALLIAVAYTLIRTSFSLRDGILASPIARYSGPPTWYSTALIVCSVWSGKHQKLLEHAECSLACRAANTCKQQQTGQKFMVTRSRLCYKWKGFVIWNSVYIYWKINLCDTMLCRWKENVSLLTMFERSM